MMKGHMTSESMYRLIGKVTVRRLTAAVLSRRHIYMAYRMGQFREHGLKELMIKGLFNGLKSFKMEFYIYFVMGKQSKVSFNMGNTRQNFS